MQNWEHVRARVIALAEAAVEAEALSESARAFVRSELQRAVAEYRKFRTAAFEVVGGLAA